MAKVAKAKRTEVSVHSRAARRAASPSLDVDKSILNAERPQTSTSGGYGHSEGYGGVEKKRKQKKLSRQQRLRLEKGMERAEQNMDKLIKKVEDSRTREKKVKTRNAPWEELNERDATDQLPSMPSGLSTINNKDIAGQEAEHKSQPFYKHTDLLMDSKHAKSAAAPSDDSNDDNDDEIL